MRFVPDQFNRKAAGDEVRRLLHQVDDDGNLPSQSALARHLEISSTSVNKWSRDKGDPDQEHWPGIEEFFDLEPGHLARIAGAELIRAIPELAAAARSAELLRGLSASAELVYAELDKDEPFRTLDLDQSIDTIATLFLVYADVLEAQMASLGAMNRIMEHIDLTDGQAEESSGAMVSAFVVAVNAAASHIEPLEKLTEYCNDLGVDYPRLSEAFGKIDDVVRRVHDVFFDEPAAGLDVLN